MPHFVIHCSENIFELKAPKEMMQEVYDVARSTGLFDEGDIKVRIQPFKHYNVGSSDENFIHVFGYILEGRPTSQKANLSKHVITKLKMMFPEVRIISMNISDFEKATYCNKWMI
jgi:5-carboxymethyl-2-hydroxymuconate isomerase